MGTINGQVAVSSLADTDEILIALASDGYKWRKITKADLKQSLGVEQNENDIVQLQSDTNLNTNKVDDVLNAVDRTQAQAGNVVTNGQIGSDESVNGNQAGPSYSVLFNAGNVQTLTATGDIELTFTQMRTGFSYVIVINNSGGNTITFADTIKWLTAQPTNETDMVITILNTSLGIYASFDSV